MNAPTTTEDAAPITPLDRLKVRMDDLGLKFERGQLKAVGVSVAVSWRMSGAILTLLQSEFELQDQLSRRSKGEGDSASPRQVAALREASSQFAFYAEEHRKKGTPEADSKARTNEDWAIKCQLAADDDTLAASPAPPDQSDRLRQYEAAIERAAETLELYGEHDPDEEGPDQGVLAREVAAELRAVQGVGNG